MQRHVCRLTRGAVRRESLHADLQHTTNKAVFRVTENVNYAWTSCSLGINKTVNESSGDSSLSLNIMSETKKPQMTKINPTF